MVSYSWLIRDLRGEYFRSADGPFQVAGLVYEGDLQVQRCFYCLLGGLTPVFVLVVCLVA
jgi:hypothetical protein